MMRSKPPLETRDGTPNSGFTISVSGFFWDGLGVQSFVDTRLDAKRSSLNVSDSSLIPAVNRRPS
jgi:hypothetical protein